jgi:hypothetical protein
LAYFISDFRIIDSGNSRKQNEKKAVKRLKHKATKKCREAADWLDVRYFNSAADVLEALKVAFIALIFLITPWPSG